MTGSDSNVTMLAPRHSVLITSHYSGTSYGYLFLNKLTGIGGQSSDGDNSYILFLFCFTLCSIYMGPTLVAFRSLLTPFSINIFVIIISKLELKLYICLFRFHDGLSKKLRLRINGLSAKL
jgi:hypothetical protein